MKIQENIPLAQYTTFKIGGPARFFCVVANETELLEAVKFAQKEKLPFFVLGGGSNILISDDGFSGLIIKIELKGISLRNSSVTSVADDIPVADEFITASVREQSRDEADTFPRDLAARGDSSRGNVVGEVGETVSAENVPATGAVTEVIETVSVAAGEIFDDFIEYAVAHELYGLENLSAIPGTVGAAPVQNIGAYGAEVSNSIESVRVLDTKKMEFVLMPNKECVFAYRDSIFKHEKGRYIIVGVNFKLSKKGKLNTDYKDIQEYFSQKNISEPTISEVRQAIIEIRSEKLPDWKLWGTAGSFFKNPVVAADKFKELKKQYPGLPGFPEPDGRVKLSLGWILDRICHVKGLKYGKAQVYEKQALVLVTMSGAMASDVVLLSRELMKLVKDKTGVEIEGEVEWVI